MAVFNLDVSCALYIIQQRHFCVNIEFPMLSMLSAYETILTAKRDVARTRRAMMEGMVSTGLPTAVSAKKRDLDDMDDDENMEDSADSHGEVARMPLAPFTD